MNEEELERTNMMKTMIIESSDYEEDDSIIEHIEEFEEKIDYLDIDEKQKEKLKSLCTEIKEEENEKTREYLFKLLQKEID
ncbi:MAG: hypothetical protein HFE81_05740 [Bacilli bacterium]|nr:hypothetical protein [Bacilli bacterium]